jgi:hypothetical protein
VRVRILVHTIIIIHHHPKTMHTSSSTNMMRIIEMEDGLVLPQLIWFVSRQTHPHRNLLILRKLYQPPYRTQSPTYVHSRDIRHYENQGGYNEDWDARKIKRSRSDGQNPEVVRVYVSPVPEPLTQIFNRHILSTCPVGVHQVPLTDHARQVLLPTPIVRRTLRNSGDELKKLVSLHLI